MLELPQSWCFIHERGLDIGTVQLLIDISDVFPELSDKIAYVFFDNCWIFEVGDALGFFLGCFFIGINGNSFLRFAILALEVVIVVHSTEQSLMFWFFYLDSFENVMVILGTRTPATRSHYLSNERGYLDHTVFFAVFLLGLVHEMLKVLEFFEGWLENGTKRNHIIHILE